MIEFRRVQLKQKEKKQSILFADAGQSCEYSFANKYLWGRQELETALPFSPTLTERASTPIPLARGTEKRCWKR